MHPSPDMRKRRPVSVPVTNPSAYNSHHVSKNGSSPKYCDPSPPITPPRSWVNAMGRRLVQFGCWLRFMWAGTLWLCWGWVIVVRPWSLPVIIICLDFYLIIIYLSFPLIQFNYSPNNRYIYISSIHSIIPLGYGT